MALKDNKHITKKDSKKNIAIASLIWIIIFLATLAFGGYEKILDYITFAGTVTSIVLAVVAIVYSYYQNRQTIISKQKLVDSADKIEDVTKKLEESKIEQLMDVFNESIQSIEQSVATVDEKIEGYRDEVTESLFEADNSSSYSESEGIITSQDELCIVLKQSSTNVRRTLFLLLKIYENEIIYDPKYYQLNPMPEYKNAPKQLIDIVAGREQGIMVTYVGMGLLSYVENENSNGLKVVRYDEDLKQALLNVIEEKPLKDEYKKYVEEYIKEYN